MDETTLMEYVSTTYTQFSKTRDDIWKHVSGLKTWAERDRVARAIYNTMPGLTEGDVFDGFISKHHSERKTGEYQSGQ